jgi:NAD(P)-dependent dehydrogenase (short-subunit alcohol dehydrogenase family)
MNGKVVVIAGATSGIGQVAAELLGNNVTRKGVPNLKHGPEPQDHGQTDLASAKLARDSSPAYPFEEGTTLVSRTETSRIHT